MMLKSFFAVLAIVVFHIHDAQSQNYKFSNYKNDYHLNYLNENAFEDLRKPKTGTKAYTFMYLIPFLDLSQVEWSLANDSTITSGPTENRVLESFFPSFRYYLSESTCITIGIIFGRTSTSGSGEIDTTLTPAPILTDAYKAKISKAALRVAYDKHFKVFRRRLFDIDPYFGASLNTGISPIKVISEETYLAGDYYNETTSSSYFTWGGDLYLGTSFRFERFSLGGEVLMLGWDFQNGYGKTKIEYDGRIGGEVQSGTYYTSDNWNSLYAFSKLKISSSSTTMYRGFRFNFTFYLL
jgi:hypothetical protein